MGLFDHYRPARETRCPACGQALREWQGKDGPNFMFVWAEGVGGPIDQDVDDECKVDDADRALMALPPEFTIYSYDCPDHQPIDARCTAHNGVWSTTEVQPFELARGGKRPGR